jgi:hypothetical protein
VFEKYLAVLQINIGIPSWTKRQDEQPVQFQITSETCGTSAILDPFTEQDGDLNGNNS